jgi:predicted ATPase
LIADKNSSDKNKYVIAVVGAQGCGKTTLIQYVENEVLNSFKAPILFVKEIARLCPYNIGVKSDKVAQTWILRTQNIMEHVAIHLQKPVVLDRCILDQYAYYRYWGGRNSEIEHLIQESLYRYYKIFFLPPNPNFLKDDGVRPTDPLHQIEISDLILNILENHATSAQLVKCEDTSRSVVDEILGSLMDIININTSCDLNPQEWFFEGGNFGEDILPSFNNNEILYLIEKLIHIDNFCYEDFRFLKYPKELELWLRKVVC